MFRLIVVLGLLIAAAATGSAMLAAYIPQSGPGGVLIYAVEDYRNSPNSTVLVMYFNIGEIMEPVHTRLLYPQSLLLNAFAGKPACSPDGRHVVFSSNYFPGDYTRPSYRLFVRDLYSEQTQVIGRLSGFGELLDPAWSPDGNTLAFSHRSFLATEIGGEGAHITLAAPDDAIGTQWARLTHDAFNYNPAWSLDGTQLLFESESDIYVLDIDGTNQRLLIENGRYPRWSPDGSQVVFARSDEQGIAVYTQAVDGDDPIRLTPEGIAVWRVDWSPDAHYIAFVGSVGDESRLYVMHIDSGKIATMSDTVFAARPYAQEVALCWLR